MSLDGVRTCVKMAGHYAMEELGMGCIHGNSLLPSPEIKTGGSVKRYE